jgi:mRNA interferase YafQ
VDERIQARLSEGKYKPRHRDLDALLGMIGNLLAVDEGLEAKYRDHVPGGEYTGHRECHLKPDLLLIYKKPDAAPLRYVRIGSHSELF